MKNNYLSLLFLLLFLSVQSQSNFQNNIISGRDTTLPGEKKFQSVDIDNDGDNDLLSVSKDENAIGWFENLDGEGSFGTYKLLVSYDFPIVNAYASDIDNDGDIDLFAVLKFSESVVWFENLDGLGNFSENQLIADINLGFGIDTVYSVDIDGDNDTDVFYSGPNTLGWNENLDGLGTFGPQQYTPSGSIDAHSLVFADLDTDSDLDLLFIRNSTIIWVENMDGQGTFGPDQVISSDVDDPKSVFAADLDNDGYIDVLSASSDDGKIAWYKNTDGSGNFGSQTVISVMERAVSIAAADLDNDNDMDIAVIIDETTNPYSFVRLFENLDGLGNFGNMETVALIEYSTTILLSDVDGDSNLEIIANEQFFSGSYTFDDLIWFKNNSQLTNFGPKQRVIGSVWTHSNCTAFDIDSDGDLDVLASSFSDGLIFYHENINGQYGPQKIIWSIPGATAVATADIDNDGDLDILFSADPQYNNNGRIGWFENLDGFGNFGNVQDVTTDNYNGSDFVEARDMDNDGDLDILEANRWYENTDGLGNFVTRQWGGYAADLDGDNDLDLIFDKYVYMNVDGLGNFDVNQTLNGATNYTHIDLFDVDEDGDVDILMSSWYSNKIFMYENLDGLGNFGDRLDLFDLENASFAKHVDIDSDGDLDIVASATSTNDFKTVWYENTGGGNYGPEQIIANRTASYLTFFDMDIDGDIDILHISRNLAWYENLISENLSVNDNAMINFKIYPNPSSQFLTIESLTKLKRIDLFDVNGKKIKSIKPKSLGNREFIDISYLPQGLVFIKIIDENGSSVTKKLIKE